LARKPKILLLDEPLSALDNKMRNKLQEYLLKLMDHFSFTSILVSHDLQEVKALADQLVNIKDGKIVSIQERNEFNFLN
jgi:molybdate transport system ATP-binding protein